MNVLKSERAGAEKSLQKDPAYEKATEKASTMEKRAQRFLKLAKGLEKEEKEVGLFGVCGLGIWVGNGAWYIGGMWGLGLSRVLRVVMVWVDWCRRCPFEEQGLPGKWLEIRLNPKIAPKLTEICCFRNFYGHRVLQSTARKGA